MKKMFILISMLLLSNNVAVWANEVNNQEVQQSVNIAPEAVVIHPQPLTVGDAEISLKVPAKIISTSIYTVTGQRIIYQVYDSETKVVKAIPYDIESGEYLLKIVTENGIALRRIFVR
jgi:hypothetical protein